MAKTRRLSRREFVGWIGAGAAVSAGSLWVPGCCDAGNGSGGQGGGVDLGAQRQSGGNAYSGYVHGAVLTGIREAERLLGREGQGVQLESGLVIELGCDEEA